MPGIETWLKLGLGILAFVLIGWFGARDKRLGGILLTFPLLNGLAMLTDEDPFGIAATIYPVVMFNSLLFLAAISWYEFLPPLPQDLHRDAKIGLRVLAWALMWFAGGWLLATYRDRLPSVWTLFVIQFVFAFAHIWHWWRLPSARSDPPTLAEMWFNRWGCLRVLCFVAAFLILLGVAYWLQNPRWVGLASALPLPGLFALATLSATQKQQDLLSLRDTVLLGPLLVIPFNWLLAQTIASLRTEQAGTMAEIAVVLLFWIVAAVSVFVLTPQLARWRDELRTNARK